MKRIYLALGSMAGLAVLVLLTGLFLPVEHTATSSATFDSPADDVWAVVSDLAGTAGWRGGVDRMERVEGTERETWREHGQYGAMTYEVEERDDVRRRLVMRIVGDDAFGGTWTYQVEEAGGGSSLTITEDGEVYNPVFRFVARFVMGHHGTMDAYLRSLGERLGQPVEPDHRD